MNFERYPWLRDLESPEAVQAIAEARQAYQETGAHVLADFVAPAALAASVQDCRAQEDQAFTTDDTHTAYLKSVDTQAFAADSIYNHSMRTHVASIAYDELPRTSPLVALYRDDTLRQLISKIVDKDLYLSADPLGCCSVNVFRPGYHHSFHFDESEFSTTIMLQEATETESGLFQYTHPLRRQSDDLVLSKVAQVIHEYDKENEVKNWKELPLEGEDPVPPLHTLDFRPGTLSIFAGSQSLHRVTRVKGDASRLVAVLTFATEPGFCNSAEVQKLFWGRSATAS